MSKKKDIIRIGDYVRVVNPLVVDRVGYPLCKMDMVKKQTPEQIKSIEDMLKAFDYVRPYSEEGSRQYDFCIESIRYRMAAVMLRSEGWGGQTRTIHTVTLPDMRGQRAEVVGRRVVKTGTHCSGYMSYDYYSGGEDYEPSTLSDEKTHVIYKLQIIGQGGENWSLSQWWTPESKQRHGYYITCDYRNIEIEKCNLRKISKEEFLRYEEPITEEHPSGLSGEHDVVLDAIQQESLHQ
jgi:hypothetical protein